jgi:histidyl-tRNA synthetase
MKLIHLTSLFHSLCINIHFTIFNKNKMSEEKKDRGDFLQAPRGMKDLMGDDFYNHQGFFEKAQEICEYYGFSPLRTPVLEHEEVFMKGVGEGTDIVDKEIYSLRTKGGDRLALRPEGTAPAMRVYIEHGMQSILPRKMA